jgi:hypothetical protein
VPRGCAVQKDPRAASASILGSVIAAHAAGRREVARVYPRAGQVLGNEDDEAPAGDGVRIKAADHFAVAPHPDHLLGGLGVPLGAAVRGAGRGSRKIPHRSAGGCFAISEKAYTVEWRR